MNTITKTSYMIVKTLSNDASENFTCCLDDVQFNFLENPDLVEIILPYDLGVINIPKQNLHVRSGVAFAFISSINNQFFSEDDIEKFHVNNPMYAPPSIRFKSVEDAVKFYDKIDEWLLKS